MCASQVNSKKSPSKRSKKEFNFSTEHSNKKTLTKGTVFNELVGVREQVSFSFVEYLKVSNEYNKTD